MLIRIGPSASGKTEVAKALPNTYGADLREIVEQIEDLPSAQQWIPCSECERRCDKWEDSKI